MNRFIVSNRDNDESTISKPSFAHVVDGDAELKSVVERQYYCYTHFLNRATVTLPITVTTNPIISGHSSGGISGKGFPRRDVGSMLLHVTDQLMCATSVRACIPTTTSATAPNRALHATRTQQANTA
jgi:hypothetical protein